MICSGTAVCLRPPAGEKCWHLAVVQTMPYGKNVVDVVYLAALAAPVGLLFRLAFHRPGSLQTVVVPDARRGHVPWTGTVPVSAIVCAVELHPVRAAQSTRKYFALTPASVQLIEAGIGRAGLIAPAGQTYAPLHRDARSQRVLVLDHIRYLSFLRYRGAGDLLPRLKIVRRGK